MQTASLPKIHFIKSNTLTKTFSRNLPFDFWLVNLLLVYIIYLNQFVLNRYSQEFLIFIDSMIKSRNSISQFVAQFIEERMGPKSLLHYSIDHLNFRQYFSPPGKHPKCLFNQANAVKALVNKARKSSCCTCGLTCRLWIEEGIPERRTVDKLN